MLMPELHYQNLYRLTLISIKTKEANENIILKTKCTSFRNHTDAALGISLEVQH